MKEISLSQLFKSQIHDQRLSKIDTVRITSSFKRVERMTDDMKRHGFDIQQMNLKIKITDHANAIFKVLPLDKKIIVKKILFT